MSQSALTQLDHACSLDIYSATAGYRQCSIICTIGPKTKGVERLSELRRAGMNIVRMNFSHGSYEYHASVIANTRKSQEDTPLNGRPVAIALDTKGPEIRTGQLDPVKCAEGDPLLEKGGTVLVHTDEAWKPKCSASDIYVDYKNITSVIKEGDSIYIDDGLISLLVGSIDASKGEIRCEIENSGRLGSHKGCNLPNVDVDLPALSEKDKKDLAFGVEQGVDMVFASFVRKAADVREVRAALVAVDPERGSRIKIISKIENHEGVRNFDGILMETDGIMVARGDLGIEIPAQKVFIAQKMMIAKCNRAGKPIICATQMLESMTYNPRPTRAEVSDVANAVLDGADCVMLSGETAKGDYPIQAVEMMAACCKEAESAMCYRQYHSDLAIAIKPPLPEGHAAAASAVLSANNADASAIIVLSWSGNTARLVSMYRPRCPIFVVSRDTMTCRLSHLNRGCVPFVYLEEYRNLWEQDVDARISWAMAKGVKDDLIRPGNSVVAVHGFKEEPCPCNTIRVLSVPS